MNELATLVEADREKHRGMAAAALLSAELIDLTRSELFAIVPESGRTFPFVPATLVPRLLERGVAVRVLHSCEAEWETPGFAALERMGAAMRSTIVLPHSIVIRDRSFLYISHPDANHPMSRQLTRVRNDVLARLLAVTFDAIWSASASRRDDDATEFRDLARLLNQGLTDERAAARLHMSRRTFARRMASMMDLLDADSRFQAGVQAAARGWL